MERDCPICGKEATDPAFNRFGEWVRSESHERPRALRGRDRDANVPFDRIEQSMSQLPSDRSAPLVVYCRSERMSTEAAQTLVRLGYTRGWHLDGGFIAWQEAGFPLIRR